MRMLRLFPLLFLAACTNSPTAPSAFEGQPAIPVSVGTKAILRGAESPDGTAITRPDQRLTDAEGQAWTLNADHDVLLDGVWVRSPNLGGELFLGRAAILMYRGGVVRALGLDDGKWWDWAGFRFEAE